MNKKNENINKNSDLKEIKKLDSKKKRKKLKEILLQA